MPDPLHRLLLDCGIPEDRAYEMCERAAHYEFDAGMTRRDSELLATGGVTAVNQEMK